VHLLLGHVELSPPIMLSVCALPCTHPRQSPWLCTLALSALRLAHMASLSAHLPLQLKDFSLMLLLKAVCCNLKVN
jgi:hypothetical protein